MSRPPRPIANDQFDLELEVGCERRIRHLRAIKHDGIARLLEEERRIALVGFLHLANVVEIVAADAIDPANGKEAAAHDRHFGRRDRGQNAMADSAHAFAPGLGYLAVVPVEDLLAVPVHDAVELVHVVVDLLEILDPERLAADVGMDRERQDLRAILALLIQPVEAVDGALDANDRSRDAAPSSSGCRSIPPYRAASPAGPWRCGSRSARRHRPSRRYI